MAPRAEAPLLPETLGPYRCLRKLAVGGMGEVYLAEASGAGEFKKRLVIKAVRADRADEKDVVQAFLDEARVWALLTHPNIVPLFDCAWFEGRLCLVMEYIEGADLRELIQAAQQQHRPIRPGVALHLTTQLAAALNAAHEARGLDGKLLGVVHRDVSPHNVLVDRQGSARLCDFGIARSALRLNRTRSGRFKGKFAYVSPEAIRGEQVDRRADVFGMGVLLYELLALERPFQADGPVPLLRNILETEPPSLRLRRPGLSEALCQAVHRALAKKASDRFPTAEAFRWALLATPEAQPPPDLAQLTAWFDSLTGMVEDEPSTEPRFLDLAARAAARSLHDEADDSASGTPVVLPRPIDMTMTTGELTLPRKKPAPPIASDPSQRGEDMQPTGPTRLRETYDLSGARTLLKPGVGLPRALPPGARRWQRRFQELWPWMLVGAAFGGVTIWAMTHFLGR